MSVGGENYGWNIMEGSLCYEALSCNQTGLTLPSAEYDHESGCSITGGHVYRGMQFPSLHGYYLYGDLCSGRIWGLSNSGGPWENTLLLDTTITITTFGLDEAGELYVADYSAGHIHRIVVPLARGRRGTKSSPFLPLREKLMSAKIAVAIYNDIRYN